MIRTTIFEGGKWIKGEDPFDGTLRYTLFVPDTVEGEGYYCPNLGSPLGWSAVVWSYQSEYGRRYGASFTDGHGENTYEQDNFHKVKEAREWAEKNLMNFISKNDDD